ncbi:MAG: hypothetical protein OEN55_11460 [Alphaproteobacteria bacterium]|nr:hypothetical protein [Alphaproteobacteria bacterium]
MSHANPRRRALLLSLPLVGLLTLPDPAAAAAANEFRAAGGGLACITETPPTEEGQMPPYRDCLRIGPVRVGETLRDVAMRFGRAGKEVRQGPVTLRVWPVRMDVPAGTSLPYWVIGFDEDRRVVSIQLTGDKRVDEFAFSSLRLGDPESRVRRILGEPVERQAVPAIGAEMWSWRPYPVTLEIKDGRVYSMRVSQAIGQ